MEASDVILCIHDHNSDALMQCMYTDFIIYINYKLILILVLIIMMVVNGYDDYYILIKYPTSAVETLAFREAKQIYKMNTMKAWLKFTFNVELKIISLVGHFYKFYFYNPKTLHH